MGKRRRKKPGVSSRVFKTSDKYIPQRAAIKDMNEASSAGKTLRDAVGVLMKKAKDAKTHERCQKKLFKVLEGDHENEKGKRKVSRGDLQLLQGVEYNVNCTLLTVMAVQAKTSIERITGLIELFIHSFVPGESINAPAAATHYKIVSAGVEVDFDNKTYITDIKESAYLSLDHQPTGNMQFTSTVTANSTLPLFLIAGIQFYTDHNGTKHASADKKYHPLCIMKVDTV